MLVTCFSTARAVITSWSAIAWFERPSAISANTSRSRAESASRGSWRRWRPRSSETTSGSRADPVGDPANRVREALDVGHAVLQEVADPLGRRGDELERVALLDVLAQHQDAGPRQLLTDLQGRANAVVGVSGWHADVDDRGIGVVRADLSQQVVGVPGVADDLQPASSSRRAIPSLKSTESSATTTRTEPRLARRGRAS